MSGVVHRVGVALVSCYCAGALGQVGPVAPVPAPNTFAPDDPASVSSQEFIDRATQLMSAQVKASELALFDVASRSSSVNAALQSFATGKRPQLEAERKALAGESAPR